MNVDKVNKVIIIGSGPAGYTAAIYAARAMLEPVLIAGSQPGGQLTITTDVENFPGFADVIQGPWLMEQMKEQALKVGTKFIEDHISKVNFNKKPFEIIGDSGNHYLTESVIISTGAQARWLNLDSEEKYKGFGVSACATCDGFFYKNKDVVVVGGGNSAVEESLFLTNFAKKITLVHRKNELKAEKLLQKKLFSHPKINVIWDSVISEIIGTENPKGVTAVKLKNIKTNTFTELQTHGLFVAIGHDPATALFKGQINMDSSGYITTQPDSTKTNIPGVFAAGDVKDKLYRQAVTAAGMGCMAALEAERYLSNH
ncbi:MAG: thioredoxin-disulfide reductase [Candidatus Fonsibacter lacus]|nr:thioredoxin-disulfide reductase [Candidatus Fonsibacter lacus]NDC44030.1 thioredoxin-disulfide reductase [Pseudomonadota bacterium]NDE65029.1 thioredoxin-disulfide reductase [Pseudomonadota bacterium]